MKPKVTKAMCILWGSVGLALIWIGDAPMWATGLALVAWAAPMQNAGGTE